MHFHPKLLQYIHIIEKTQLDVKLLQIYIRYKADFKQTKCIYFISNFLFLLPIIRQWYEQDGTICKNILNISIFIFILYWIIQFSPPMKLTATCMI
jgi:hypothetical protein